MRASSSWTRVALIAAASLGAIRGTPAQDQVLVPAGASWKYDDTGTDLGSGWRALEYDDSSWSVGPAQLGYGDGDEATVISYGPNASQRYPCSYFRHSFDVVDPAAYSSLTVKIIRDDGCVAYLNGTEVVRDNMPAGTISYGTWASTAIGAPAESTWYSFTVNASLLVPGTNVIAVEVHQGNATSTDLSFDLEIDAALAPLPAPTVVLESPPDGSTVNTTSVAFTCSASDSTGLADATLYVGTNPETVTFSGSAATDDTAIYEANPTTNYGTATTMKIDASPHAHALIKFPSLIGNGAGQVRPFSTIVSATLEINCTNAGNTLKLYRLIQDWNETEATWNSRTASYQWSTPGADGPYSRATTPVDGDCSATGLRTIDVSSMVQDWSNGSQNYGILIADSGTDGVDIDSSESANPPVLTVTFRPSWQPVESKVLSGTSATVTFNATLTDGAEHVWNCLVTNTSGQQSWAPANFTVTVDTSSPDVPVLVAPAADATGESTSPTLTASVSDPNGDPLQVTFHGREVSPTSEFTVVVLPDTQLYSESYPEIFTAQTQWIADNRASRNIVFATQSGDIINVYADTNQWGRANTSMSILDGNVPYGISPGNHDEPTAGINENFNQYFPYARYEAEAWYGGHYGTVNDDSFQLFSAGGVDFIILHLDFCPSAEVIAWADSVLEAHADRKAIITTHGYIDASGNRAVHSCTDTSYIWNDLIVPNDNVCLLFCGHVAGEYTRTDVVNGRKVHQLLADYQGLSLGGSGYLRTLRFVPAENKVYVETYSPYLDAYQTDANSQFTLDLPLSPEYAILGTSDGVPSGSSTSISWANLSPSTQYEWYVTATDPTGKSRTSAARRFTTGSGDSDPPAISNVTATNVTDVSASITWDTDEAADSTVDYGPDATYGSTVEDGSPVTAHSIALTGLLPGTTYHCQVSSTDAGGNAASSEDLSFTTDTAPVAQDQSVTTDEDTAVAIVLTATDAEEDPLTYSVVSSPAHGALSGEAPNLAYTPESDYHGADSFTFEANDGKVDGNAATVSITVTALNDPPVAHAQALAVAEDEPLAIVLSATDVDEDPLTYTVMSEPVCGVLTGTAPNLTYLPGLDYSGADSFTFKANDGTVDGNVATVSITVSSVNDPPVASAGSATTAEDTAVAIALSATDIEGDALTYAVVIPPAHGALTGSGASLTYVPELDYAGADGFTFVANDGQADSNVAAVSITVAPVNDAPVASGQSVTAAEDAAVGIALTATDVENDPLAYAVLTAPAYGTLGGVAPNLTYTPGLNYSGADSFTFVANDGQADSNVATVTITVTAVNDPPVAQDQSLSTLEDTALPITLVAMDVDGPSLGYVVAAPAHGTLSGTAPDLTYTPSPDSSGGDTFTFKATDGLADSNIATVTITVTAVNDAPVAQDQPVTTDEDTAVEITLAATDVDGDALTYALATAPTNGTLTGTAPNVTYTPNPAYAGADSFSFKASDGVAESNVATVTITVTAVNDPPVAEDQPSVITSEDTPVSITLTASDPENDALTFAIVTAPAQGALSGAAPDLTYTPNPNYSGTDSFTFVANDGQADSNVATVTIAVTSVNDPPVANAQAVSTVMNVPVPITLSATDPDPGATLTYAIVAGPTYGELTGAAPDLTYTPNPDYIGFDDFTFKANDGTADSNTATVSITVTAVNRPPVADSQSVSGAEDTALVITLVAADLDNDPLAYAVVTGPAHGTLSGAAPNLTYTPTANYNGPDSFNFKANDGQADSNVATVSITVTAVNDAPVAAGGSAGTAEDTSAAIDLAATDVDGDDLTYEVVTGPAHGILSGTAPNLTYTPTANYNGTDGFTFVANDGQADSEVVAVSITVTAVNDAPVASDGSIGTDEDTSAAIVLGATDVDGDALTYGVVTGPAHGTLSGTAPNLTYTPTANYNGADGFTFQANDGQADSNVATVSITVAPVNDAPVAGDQSVSTPEDTTLAILLSATDADGDTLTYAVVTGPAHGTLSGAAPNLTYTPTANYSGTDGFTFVANDGQADSEVAAVSITVTGVNDPPVAEDQPSVSTLEDTSVPITLTAEDLDGDSLTFTIETGPAHGELTGTMPDLTYVPDLDYGGPDSFTFTANDGQVDSNAATVSIAVLPVNDPPVASAGSASTAQDTAVAIALVATDVEGDPLTYAIVTPPAHGSLSGAAPVLTYTPAAGYSGSDSFTFKASDGTADSNVAAVSITVTAVSSVHVEGITMSIRKSGKTWRATAAVLVHDQTGAPASGAVVTGSWYFKGALVSSGVTGTTDATGTTKIQSPAKSGVTGDLFMFRVTDIALAGYTYNPAANTVTEATVPIP